MGFRFQVISHTLRFTFNARTSRGAMQQHQVWYVLLSHSANPETVGIGEFAPLPGLSPDAGFGAEGLGQFLVGLEKQNLQTEEQLAAVVAGIPGQEFPALKFAIETALLDYQTKGQRVLFPSEFTQGKKAIPINGLIWMSDKADMLAQVKSKIEQGFSCLKLKIGALDFEQELDVLRYIRQEFPEQDLTVRADANGAFSPTNALEKLKRLSEFTLHSIEQPIKPGQWQQMAWLCKASPVPIALDEELIGNQAIDHKRKLLQFTRPPFIILKPTLVGGFASAAEWIKLAEEEGIGWWNTSALESNIGLNAIAQFTAVNQPEMPQGLGTGQLYHNNIASPLRVERGYLHYQNHQAWDLSALGIRA